MNLTFLGVYIKTATFNCVSSNSLESPQLRITQLPLKVQKGQKGQKFLPIGEALNRWAEENPDKRRLTYYSLTSAGVPVELWLLYVERPLSDFDKSEE